MKKYYINKYFKTYASNIAINLAEKVVNILNETETNADVSYNIKRVVLEFADDELFMFDNQWQIIMAYCAPINANYKKAVNLLMEDIYRLIDEVEE